MVKAQARAEKESFILVRFFYGASLGSQARYTDWDQGYEGHTSEPRMSLSIPENEGTFDKRELRIILPLDSFVTRATSGVPHSPIFVEVEEITNGVFVGDQNDQRVLYRGRVVRTIKNFQGKKGRAAFFCLPQKSRLDVAMGLPCNHHCAWTLFKGGCGADVTAFELMTEIDSVDGQEVTISDATVSLAALGDDYYWKKGYLEKDGLRIPIRDYKRSTATDKFYTPRRVPDDWVGGSGDIRIVPGCDKTIETCRARFNQEETFIGLGFAIPAYQPNIESPS